MDFNVRQHLSTNRGPLLVLLSQMLSGLTNLCVKALITKFAQPISPFSILNARMIITLSLSSIYCWLKDVEGFPTGPREVRWLLLLRAVGGCCGAVGFYYSLKYLPLSEATVLNLLASLGCYVVCALLLKGTVSKVQVLAAVMSVVAVIITARPTLIFSKMMSMAVLDTKKNDVEWDRLLKGIPFALLGASGGACAYTSIRMIGTRAHPLISVNYFAVLIIIVTSISTLLERGRTTVRYSLMQEALLMVVGVLSFLVEFVMTAGLAVKESSSVLMVFSQIVFATVLDWAFWGIPPNMTSVIGGIILMASLGAALIRPNGETSTQQENSARIYRWVRSKWRRHKIYSTDVDTFSLESLLPSGEE